MPQIKVIKPIKPKQIICNLCNKIIDNVNVYEHNRSVNCVVHYK